MKTLTKQEIKRISRLVRLARIPTGHRVTNTQCGGCGEVSRYEDLNGIDWHKDCCEAPSVEYIEVYSVCG